MGVTTSEDVVRLIGRDGSMPARGGGRSRLEFEEGPGDVAAGREKDSGVVEHNEVKKRF